VDATNVTARVPYCFEKPIGSIPAAGSFHIGTYSQFERTADSASRAGTSCAAAVFAGGASPVPDPIEQTYGHVDAGAATNSANGIQNLADSSAMILPAGIGTNTGTANHHSAPTLTGCTVNNATATATFVFDKLLAAVTNNTPTGFQLETINGALIPSTGGPTNTTFSGNTVSVKFPNPPGTATGVRCVVAAGSVLALGDPGARPNNPGPVVAGAAVNPTVQAAARPGNAGTTNLPDLVSTDLASDGTYVDFVFDESINAAIGTPGAFHVVISDGRIATAGAGDVTVVNNNTVRYWPGGTGSAGFSSINEFIVQAAVDRGSVTSIGTGLTNSEGHAPAGDNQGALAAGYTAAPEALRFTRDTATGTVNILMDQRFIFSTGAIRLVDDTGTVLPFSPNSTSGSGGAAGQKTAKLTYAPGSQVSGAVNVQLLKNAVLSNAIYGNVDQVLSATATSRLVRRHGKVVWKKSHLRKVRPHRLVLRKRSK